MMVSEAQLPESQMGKQQQQQQQQMGKQAASYSQIYYTQPPKKL